MKAKIETKVEIITQLNYLLNEQISLLENTIKDLTNSRDEETKSSAGDKFETGRAMMQAEINRNAIHLNKARLLKNELAKIDINKKHNNVGVGSLLITTNGNYFISIGFGKIEVDQNNCYAISLASPVGQLFNNKIVGDIIQFQNKTFEILQLI